MKSIGENIAALRKKKSMTQEALAAEIGVSAQAVSKWENGTNLPDIQLLPILADIFGVSIDTLYGREKSKSELEVPGVFEECCEAVMNTIGTAFYNGMRYHVQQGVEVPVRDLDEYLQQYKAHLKYAYDGVLRSAVVQKENVVYYHHLFGGLLLRRPENGWVSVFEDETTEKVLALLADRDFKAFIAEFIKSKKSTFTASSICRRCGIEHTAELEEKLEESGLFLIKKVEIDEREVAVYDLFNNDRTFLIIGILMLAKEFSEYASSYYSYSGTTDFIYE